MVYVLLVSLARSKHDSTEERFGRGQPIDLFVFLLEGGGGEATE